MNNKKNLISLQLLISAVLATANISYSADRYINDTYIQGLTKQNFKNINVSAERYTENGEGYVAGDLKPEQKAGYGGGIYNKDTINFLNNNDYTGNKSDFGGAIFNQGLINSIEKEVFSDNTAVVDGGAIYNLGTIGSINGKFTGNNAVGINYDSYVNSSGRGGAIFNFGGKVIVGDKYSHLSSTIESITGKFEDNSANLNGGAIYNSGEIGSVNGTFTNNIAQNGYGGAIYNTNSGGTDYTAPKDSGEELKFGEINTINGTYTGNSSSKGGGAVYNSGNIENINATFNNNGKYTSGGKTVNSKNGGAIMNTGIVNNLYDSTFKDNSSTEKGGAVYNTGTINSQKTVNYDANTSANGGAVYNEGTYNISRYSNFTNNKAEVNGGAIYNAEKGQVTSSQLVNQTFANNSAGEKGGAIYNEGTMSLGGDPNAGGSSQAGQKNTVVFTGNSAQAGGAIYNTGSLDVKKSTFNSNTASQAGGAIYNNSDYLTLDGLAFNNNTAYSKVDEEKGDTGFGGAVFNSQGKTVTVSNSSFNGNKSGLSGGAIFNGGTANVSGNTFTGNSAQAGGAIFNQDTLNIAENTFEANSASYGGAIMNYETGKITTLGGKYNANTASIAGGAIYNAGSINTIGGSFTNNKAELGGGAIVTGQTGKLNEIKNASFSGNSTIAEEGIGGAILNGQETGKITVDSSSFNSNSSVVGGAIATTGDMDIKNSAFSGNIAKSSGGAIYNNSGTLNISSSTFDSNNAESGGAIVNAISSEKNKYGTAVINDSTFTNNTAKIAGGAITSSGDLTVTGSTFKNNSANFDKIAEDFELLYGGGAIYNMGLKDNTLTTINNSKFENNSTNVNGGAVSIVSGNVAISNSTFDSNNAGQKGGALAALATTTTTDTTTVTITDSDFTNNSAKEGGAIYLQNRNANITAQNKDVIFSGNTAEKGNDIYLTGSILNLNTQNGKTITFNSGITGQSSTVNIDGNVILNSAVTADNGTLKVELNNGIIKSSVDNYLDGTDLTLAEGTTLDLINNQTGKLNLNWLHSQNANLKIDMDLANSANPTDIINATTALGTLNLKEVNLISEMKEDTNKVTTDFNLDGLSLKLPDKGINILTNDYLYTVTAQDSTLTIDRLHEDDGMATKIDGFALAVNQNDKIGGKVDVNLDDERSFSATRDIEITGSGLEKGWTGNLSGKKLTVNGNGYKLNGNDKAGLTTDDGQILEFNDTNINGFKTNEDKKGALTVKDNGILNINAANHDVTISGVTAGEGLNANAIYLDGTGKAKANFNTYNGKTITVDNDIRSAAAGNEVKMSGNGTITFNGEIHPVTLINENNNTIHNNYVNGTVYNLKSGTVSFTKDEYLNGNGTANNLIFDGGTLNIANGSVNSISLNELSVNSNSNIMVDADLAAGKMDSISADKVNEIGEGINLNVNGINLLSDAKDKTTVINFVNDESLIGHITSSVSNVAYSPIYKYGVGYDAATGNFEFVRGSSSDYQNINPAIMVAPVAAQLGGYFNQLNAYDQAFSNMDMTMLMTKEQRQALKMYNKYALGKKSSLGEIPSVSGAVPEERAGLWARPYSSFENVDLKNGPNVSNVMYGSFFGGDTSIKELGHGFDGVFSLYAGYNGSHQVFNGNSLWQNGGTVGLTGTLYKGNWFGGWTIAGGLSGVDATTMYGSEDFMLWSAGTAIKTGYNWELLDGKFIIQPHYLMSYTFVDTENFRNAAGYRISSDPLNAIQLVPGLKFIGNLKNGWQPYLGVDFVWNIMDKTKFEAAQTSLPQLSVKPYVQYGLGVQKRWGDRFTGYLQAMFRNGGRNGVIFSAGFRSSFGHGK